MLQEFQDKLVSTTRKSFLFFLKRTAILKVFCPALSWRSALVSPLGGGKIQTKHQASKFNPEVKRRDTETVFHKKLQWVKGEWKWMRQCQCLFLLLWIKCNGHITMFPQTLLNCSNCQFAFMLLSRQSGFGCFTKCLQVSKHLVM